MDTPLDQLRQLATGQDGQFAIRQSTAYLACWPNAVISHESAARFHGLRRVPAPQKPVVTVPHDQPRGPSGVVVHRSRSLENRDVLRVDGVRYTTLARTVCDLACADDPWETLGILDDAVARGARPGWIHHRTRELARGRDGLALLREATRPDAAEMFRSWLERVSSHVIERRTCQTQNGTCACTTTEA